MKQILSLLAIAMAIHSVRGAEPDFDWVISAGGKLHDKVRGLAVTSSKRVRALPDVPTLREVLNNDLLIQENWTGLAAHIKTPRELVTRLHAETVKAIADPAMIKVIEAGGNIPSSGESPEQFGQFIRREYDKWREVVKLSGLKLE